MKNLLSFCLVLILSTITLAQDYTGMTGAEICSHNKSKSEHINPLDMSPNTPRHSYDVLNYKLNLDIIQLFQNFCKKFYWNGTTYIPCRFNIKFNSTEFSLYFDWHRFSPIIERSKS